MRFCPEAGGATTISTSAAETPVEEVARVVVSVSGIESVADGGRLATSVVVAVVSRGRPLRHSLARASRSD